MSEKLRTLTSKQLAMLPEIRDEWIAIGLSCEPLDFERAKAAASAAYREAGLEPPPHWIHCQGPLSGAITDAAIQGDKSASSVRDSVWDSVWDSVYGAHDAHWLAFYDTFRRFGILSTKRLIPLNDLARSCGWWIPRRGLCILQDRHCELHRNARGQLHRDGGMAVKYPDGWGVYALNGVRMKAEHVETPAEKLDGRSVLAESNVEMRRELIRKIGIERMLSHLPHKLLDSQGHYELLAVDLGAEAKGCRYLKMLNPSIGVWHLEGVANECKTVQHALNWRAGNIEKEWKPIEIT